MSLAGDRKRRHAAAAESLLTPTSPGLSVLDANRRPSGTLHPVRPFSTEQARRVRTRVGVQLRLKSGAPTSEGHSPSPTAAPPTSSAPRQHAHSPLSAMRDVSHAFVTGSARRLMNYLSTEWADTPSAPSNHSTHSPAAQHTPPDPADPPLRSSRHQSHDVTPAKRQHSNESPVDLTLSSDSQSRPRKLRHRLAHQDIGRRASPAHIRVPPPGDSSDEEGEEEDAVINEQPSAPPLHLGSRREQSGDLERSWDLESGERKVDREGRGKRSLSDGGEIEVGTGHGVCEPSQAAKQSRAGPGLNTSTHHTIMADSDPPRPDIDLPPVSDHHPLSHQPSGTAPMLSSLSTPPAGPSHSPYDSGQLPSSSPAAAHAAPQTAGLKNFVADLLSQLPSGHSLQQHGAVLQNMLQGNIGIQPKLAAVHQALAQLSDIIENKTEHLMGSYAQLLQQYMEKVRELEAAQASLRDKDAQLAERENTIQQLQAALSEAHATSASSSSALEAAQREAEASKEAFQQEVLCQICFEKRKSVLLMPCLHFLYCQDCVSRCFQQAANRTCPTCRTAVAGTMNVHLQAS